MKAKTVLDDHSLFFVGHSVIVLVKSNVVVTCRLRVQLTTPAFSFGQKEGKRRLFVSN